jgi:hypothetical protein
MFRLLSSTVVVFAIAAIGVAAPEGKFIFVDLTKHTNQKRDDPFGSGRAGNDLKSLGKDSRTMAGINFKLSEGVIQLGSMYLAKKKPNKVEGIKVGHLCKKVHIVQGTGYGNGQGIGAPGKEGEPGFIAEGTKIAEYKIHYDDGKSEIIPVVYGEDVRDWLAVETAPGVKRGKIAWKGENELSKEVGCGLRLYITSWDNPHPTKHIIRIDFAKVDDGPAAPFCVAITLEAK